MSYTPPAANAVNFQLKAFTPPAAGAVDFELAGGPVVHETSGALAGAGPVIVGASARERIHPTGGVLAGSNALIVGAAVRFRAFLTSGNLVGVGAVVDGVASRTAAPVTHETTGALVGPGSIISGEANGAGELFVDTHDGYWSKQWLKLRQKKEELPTIAEVVEIVKSSPQVMEVVRAQVEVKYPQVDYSAVLANVQLQRFIARQLIEAAQEEDDIEMMLML